MTLIERNQKLYELRKELDRARLNVAWIENDIMAVRAEYEREQFKEPGNDLFTQMFGG